MKNIFLFCTLFILIISCVNNDYSSPEKEELISDKKVLEEIISPDFMTRVDNKLVISSSKSDTKLYIYTLPDLKYLNCTGSKGSGPEEYQLFPMFCESLNQALYVWGYDPVTIKKFDVNENGELITSDIIKLLGYEAFNCMNIINDSLFIYYLPDQLKIELIQLFTCRTRKKI